MSTEAPRYNQGLITIALENGQSIALTPQECWEVTEKARAFLFESFSKLDPVPLKSVQKNGKSFDVAVTEHAVFWNRVNKGRWEPHTFEIFDHFLSDDCTYLDIGAWIGPTALYAAQRAKQVHAFEPDPLAYRELSVNVNANKEAEWASRLNIHNKAVAAKSGTIKLGSRKRGGDSMSSILFADKETSWDVEAITLQQFIEAGQLQHEKLFIKIDIEGGEYALLPGIKNVLAQSNVGLYLSVHPFFLAESQPQQNSLSGKIVQRLAFLKHQITLLRSLPFRYLYDIHGRKINLVKQLLKAALLGEFIHEIIGVHEPWDKK